MYVCVRGGGGGRRRGVAKTLGSNFNLVQPVVFDCEGVIKSKPNTNIDTEAATITHCAHYLVSDYLNTILQMVTLIK